MYLPAKCMYWVIIHVIPNTSFFFHAKIILLWSSMLTYWGLVTHQWTRSVLVQLMACCLRHQSHYLNQCWCAVKCPLWDKLLLIFNQNPKIYWQKNASFQNVFAILLRLQWVNVSGAESWTFLENKVNSMSVDALAPRVARPSAAMISTTGK